MNPKSAVDQVESFTGTKRAPVLLATVTEALTTDQLAKEVIEVADAIVSQYAGQAVQTA